MIFCLVKVGICTSNNPDDL
ncbi:MULTISPECIES: hypothetical protein [Enterobacter cloacae complex]